MIVRAGTVRSRVRPVWTVTGFKKKEAEGMRRRKLISVITAVAAAAALLAGCGSRAASGQNVVPDTAVEAEESSRSGESETQSGAAEQAAAETQTETGPGFDRPGGNGPNRGRTVRVTAG